MRRSLPSKSIINSLCVGMEVAKICHLPTMFYMDLSVSSMLGPFCAFYPIASEVGKLKVSQIATRICVFGLLWPFFQTWGHGEAEKPGDTQQKAYSGVVVSINHLFWGIYIYTPSGYVWQNSYWQYPTEIAPSGVHNGGPISKENAENDCLCHGQNTVCVSIYIYTYTYIYIYIYICVSVIHIIHLILCIQT